MKPLQARRFKFGEFEIDITRRLLLKNGEPVALNSKTFDLLLTLIEQRGEVVSKDDLLDKVWEGQFVEEANLKVQVSTLRKVFGEKRNENRFIATVPGRGYSFVAELDEDDEIVVESHSLSRIVVEEEISDDISLDAHPGSIDVIAKGGSARSGAGRHFSNRYFIAAIAAILILGTGGYLLFRSVGARGSTVPFQHMSIKRLTSKGNVGTCAISPDGKLFAYTVPELDQESLWLGNVEGGEPVQIRTAAHVIYSNLRFAPDGGSIYYTVSENFGNGTLYRMPIFGGAPEKLRDNFRELTFAPDGKQFAFVKYDEATGEPILLAADANGANERQIAILPKDLGSGWHGLAWSPDGSKIALAANISPDDARAFILNISDNAITPLPKQNWRTIRSTSWLRDESGLIISAFENESVLSQLWFVSYPDGISRRLTTDLSLYFLTTPMTVDGSIMTVAGANQSNIWVASAANLNDAKQITFGSPGQDAGWNGLAWTTDGRIIYTAENSAGLTIWIMNTDGRNQKQLIPDGGQNYYPSVTDDDRYIVFQSSRSGHFAVWRSDLNGENMVQLTGEPPASRPFVSPDGKWIIYIATSDGPGELWRTTIDGTEPHRLLEGGADWAQISSDSTTVACQLNIDGKPKLAILPIDGSQPAKIFDIPRLANPRLGIRWTPDGKSVTYRDWADGIWQQSLAGGEPQKLAGLPKEKLYGYGWSHDGREFAFTRGSAVRDVILIRDSK